MSKVDILRLDSVTANDTTATAALNQNFQSIQEAIEKTLSRDGETPNYMTSVLDMNSQRIINTAAPVDDLDVVNKRYLDSFVGDIQQQVADVQEAAEVALQKANNAASSATSAAVNAASAQESARKAAEDAATSAQAAEDISGYLEDPNLVAVGEDLREGENGLIYQAVDAAQTILATDYAVDLSFSSNKLQLKDQNGDDIGNSVTFATVASTGSYNSLSNRPDLAAVATSGSYNDLSNKPTIPTVNNATITLKQGNTTKGSFTLNQSSNATIEFDAGGGSSLPDQTGENGKFLMTDGTDASWESLPIDSSVDAYSTNDSAVGSKLFYDTCGDIEALINAL